MQYCSELFISQTIKVNGASGKKHRHYDIKGMSFIDLDPVVNPSVLFSITQEYPCPGQSLPATGGWLTSCTRRGAEHCRPPQAQQPTRAQCTRSDRWADPGRRSRSAAATRNLEHGTYLFTTALPGQPADRHKWSETAPCESERAPAPLVGWFYFRM